MAEKPAAELGESTDSSDSTTRTLYVQTHGAKLRSRRGCLVVTSGDEEVLAVPTELVDAVVCIGEIGLTSDARSDLLYRDVPVVFIAASGRYRGSLRSPGAVDADRLRAQIFVADDEQRSLQLAQRFVTGKVQNMAALLTRFGEGIDLGDVVERLDAASGRIAATTSREELLGVEGAASASYFGAWPLLLPDWCGFRVRRRDPPPDPVNAALGFGYSLLAGWAEAALVASKLEPAIGLLHASDRARPALALDLMEEFRALLVDQVVLETLRKGSLSDASFEPGAEPDSMWLSKTGRRSLTRSLEQRYEQRFRYELRQRTVSYRRAIFLQAQQLAKSFIDGATNYEPVRWRR